MFLKWIFSCLKMYVDWLVVLEGNIPIRQYFNLYWAVSQREGERGGQMRVVVVVVALLFYVHGKHLRSCRDGQLT